MRRDPPDPSSVTGTNYSSPRAALETARELFDALEEIPSRLPSGVVNPDYYDHAAVLADVLIYAGRPDFAEQLALALAGRGSRFGLFAPGTRIPEHEIALELAYALLEIHGRMFPQRIGPWSLRVGVDRRGILEVIADHPDGSVYGAMSRLGTFGWLMGQAPEEGMPRQVHETARAMLAEQIVLRAERQEAWNRS